MEEEQRADTAGAAEGGGQSVKDEEEVKEEDATHTATQGEEEEDEDALPHSEILDIFEEGLARLVQDPLLCDLPIQVLRTLHEHAHVHRIHTDKRFAFMVKIDITSYNDLLQSHWYIGIHSPATPSILIHHKGAMLD